MVTGAFPIGLKSRTLKRKLSYVNVISWCVDITKDFLVDNPDCETLNMKCFYAIILLFQKIH